MKGRYLSVWKGAVLRRILLPGLLVFALVAPVQAGKGYIRTKDGISVTLPTGILRITPLDDRSVRIRFAPEGTQELPELIFTEKLSAPSYRVSENRSKLSLRCRNLTVECDKQTGLLSFADASGKVFLRERAGSRSLIPDSTGGQYCICVTQAFESPEGERLYGLGQFQDGHYDLRGVPRRLVQVNTQIALPFLYSDRGYGLLWHQYGLTDFNPSDAEVLLQKQEQTGETDRLAEVTTTSGTVKISQQQSLYQGTLMLPDSGEVAFLLNLGGMGNRHLLVIDGKPCIDQSNMWLPPAAGVKLHLTAGEHRVEVVCKSDNRPRLTWKRTEPSTTFRSPHSQGLDYTVFYGPTADEVIASYRSLSGQAPLLPLWAYGFWQCRERYTSGNHLLQTVQEFRRRKLPMDVIVQDWQYWGKYGWGVPKFDETHYPEPDSFIAGLHALNAHFSVSVWENLAKYSDLGKRYVEQEAYLPNSPWVDVFKPEARQLHWDVLNENLFSKGVDSWWMDATEPENDALHGAVTHLGPGDFYRLTYPLFVSQAVYEGQRKTNPDKRVCILTRSAFPGQQRYGTINWSGDIGGTWDSFRRQVVAGLQFSLSGMPYWTTDIGGFFRPGRSQYTDSAYQELLVRWFQYGTFNPIFRVHGYQSETEPWKYAATTENCMRSMLELRYRLLPYIYSEAWQVTNQGSTMMRPLVIDFREDPKASASATAFLFGKALLVTPVLQPNLRKQLVYLPASTGWYDFWTGRRYEGGVTVQADAPLEKIPLFVREGALLPVGPVLQHSAEKRSDSLEIRIFEGRDGSFTLYEDENDRYDYENGRFATIPFHWDDVRKILTIGERSGSFPGMTERLCFRMVRVKPGQGVGPEETTAPDRVVTYEGKRIVVRF